MSKFIIQTAHLCVSYTVADIRQRPRNCVVGFIAVFLVTFFSSLLVLSTSKTPYVMLRLAELQVGEMDMLMVGQGNTTLINYTDISKQLDQSSEIAGHAPRWMLRGEVRAKGMWGAVGNESTSANIVVLDSIREPQIGIGRAWPHRTIGYSESQVYAPVAEFLGLSPNVGQQMQISLALDRLLREQGINSGTIPGIPSANVNVSEVVAGLGNISIGSITIGNITITNTTISQAQLQELLAANNITDVAVNGIANTTLGNLLTPVINFLMTDAVQSSEGKYPALLGNPVILDYHTLIEQLANSVCLGTSSPLSGTLPAVDTLQQTLQGISLTDVATMVIMMLPNRYETYYGSDASRTKALIKSSNSLYATLGVNFSLPIQYPIASALQAFTFLQVLLDSIFTAVIVVVVVLGVLLVHVLLDTNTSERQFEMALLRAQGLRSAGLAALLVTQAVAFTVPAIAVALAALAGVNAAVEAALSNGLTAAPPNFVLGPTPPILGAAVGVITLVLSYGPPLRRALGKSLRDALDVYRLSGTEVKVTMTRLSELGIDVPNTAMGVFLATAGFAVYYLMPLSFLINNLQLFFVLLNLMLLTLLLGLCMLMYTTQGVLQRALLWLMLWFREKRLSMLIHRSLFAHKTRNTSTFFMFTLSIAAVIFGYALFSQLSSSMTDTIRVATGSDIVLASLSFSYPLNHTFLESFLSTQSIVAGFSFATFPLAEFPQNVRGSTRLVSFADDSRSVPIVGLTRRFQNSVYSQFVVFESQRPLNYSTSQGKLDVVESLFTIRGTAFPRPDEIFTGYPRGRQRPNVNAKYNTVISAIVASSVDDIFGFSAGTYGTIEFQYKLASGSSDFTTTYLAEMRALASRVSGFAGLTDLQFAFRSGAVLISSDDFVALLNSNSTDFSAGKGALPANAVTSVRYQKCFIRLVAGATKAQRRSFTNALQSRVDPYFHVPVDTDDVVESVSTATNFLLLFFYFVVVVILILDAVMLWLAFVSNVRSQAWTYGVLRSLGFSAFALTRAYIYEALAVTLSAYIAGTVVGIIVAVVITLQVNVFLQFPFELHFLAPLYFSMVGVSVLAAIVGSAVPSWQLSRKPIAGVIKGG